MKVYEIYGQFYLLPSIKFTYTRQLNGSREFIFVWLKWEVVF